MSEAKMMCAVAWILERRRAKSLSRKASRFSQFDGPESSNAGATLQVPDEIQFEATPPCKLHLTTTLGLCF